MPSFASPACRSVAAAPYESGRRATGAAWSSRLPPSKPWIRRAARLAARRALDAASRRRQTARATVARGPVPSAGGDRGSGLLAARPGGASAGPAARIVGVRIVPRAAQYSVRRAPGTLRYHGAVGRPREGSAWAHRDGRLGPVSHLNSYLSSHSRAQHETASRDELGARGASG